MSAGNRTTTFHNTRLNSALQRQHEDLITKAAQTGAGIIIRGGIARGEPDDARGRKDVWDTFDKAGLGELLERGEGRSAFVLRFTLTHPHCHTTIVGTMQPDHFKENVKTAMKGPLSDDVYQEAKKRLDTVGQSPEGS